MKAPRMNDNFRKLFLQVEHRTETEEKNEEIREILEEEEAQIQKIFQASHSILFGPNKPLPPNFLVFLKIQFFLAKTPSRVAEFTEVGSGFPKWRLQPSSSLQRRQSIQNVLINVIYKALT